MLHGESDVKKFLRIIGNYVNVDWQNPAVGAGEEPSEKQVTIFMQMCLLHAELRTVINLLLQ